MHDEFEVSKSKGLEAHSVKGLSMPERTFSMMMLHDINLTQYVSSAMSDVLLSLIIYAILTLNNNFKGNSFNDW